MASTIKCPKCGKRSVVSAYGGTNRKPVRGIKYLCSNVKCLYEFGDKELKEARNRRRNKWRH